MSQVIRFPKRHRRERPANKAAPKTSERLANGNRWLAKIRAQLEEGTS